MKPPQSFLDFTKEFHQDLGLVHPGWAENTPQVRHVMYADVRQRYGDAAVRDLAAYFTRMLAEPDHVLGALWCRKSEAEWGLPGEGVRRIFEEFGDWAAGIE